MFDLKPLSKDAVEAALAKAERYRLLNEPDEAESICLDVLEIEPENQAAQVMLLLALSDQCGEAAAPRWPARSSWPASSRTTTSAGYYSGLVAERRARAHLDGGGAAPHGAYDWLMDALDYFERAEAVRPAGNDDAILRWNTCVRVLQKQPAAAAVDRDARRALFAGIESRSVSGRMYLELRTMSILIVTGDGGESYETWFAVHRFQEAGYKTRVAAPSKSACTW